MNWLSVTDLTMFTLVATRGYFYHTVDNYDTPFLIVYIMALLLVFNAYCPV